MRIALEQCRISAPTLYETPLWIRPEWSAGPTTKPWVHVGTLLRHSVRNVEGRTDPTEEPTESVIIIHAYALYDGFMCNLLEPRLSNPFCQPLTDLTPSDPPKSGPPSDPSEDNSCPAESDGET